MFGKKTRDSQPNEDNNITGLIQVSGCENLARRGDVVFVHGLAGHPWDTWHWQSSSSKDYQKI